MWVRSWVRLLGGVRGAHQRYLQLVAGQTNCIRRYHPAPCHEEEASLLIMLIQRHPPQALLSLTLMRAAQPY
ncbi:MAG: hypothetical protein VKJ04_01290 [Vampirovibrionales bacterium]|nr:hypothetical protein [Vampirovibrionales bacterium]